AGILRHLGDESDLRRAGLGQGIRDAVALEPVVDVIRPELVERPERAFPLPFPLVPVGENERHVFAVTAAEAGRNGSFCTPAAVVGSAHSAAIRITTRCIRGPRLV